MHISQAWAVFARRSLRTAMIWSLAGVALIGCSEVQEKYGFRTLGVPRPVSVSEPDNPQAGLRSVGFARMGAQGRDALTRDVYDYGGGSRTWGGGPKKGQMGGIETGSLRGPGGPLVTFLFYHCLHELSL